MVVLLVCLSMVADDHLKTPSHPLHVRPELNFKDLLLDSPPMYVLCGRDQADSLPDVTRRRVGGGGERLKCVKGFLAGVPVYD